MVRVRVDEKSRKRAEEFALSILGSKILKKAIEATEKMDIIDSEDYIKGFKMNIGEGYVEVGNTAPYAKVIEYGASPHFPPFKPIYEWVLEKKGERDEEAVKATWRIINKIGKEGAKPNYILTHAVIDTVREANAVYSQSITRGGKQYTVYRDFTGRFIKGGGR